MGIESPPEADIEFEKALDIYLEMKGASKVDEELERLFRIASVSVARYNQTIARFNHIERRRLRGDEASRDEIEAADHARKRAHDALIDNLNILSRGFAKKGLDNNWRKLIGLDSREQITEWAIHVGEWLARQREKREA